MRPWALLSIVLLFPAAVCAQDAAVLRDSGERKFQARDYEGAVQDYQQALAGLPSGQDSAAAAGLLLQISSALYGKTDYPGAKARAHQAVEIYQRLNGAEYPLVARALSSEGGALLAGGGCHA